MNRALIFLLSLSLLGCNSKDSNKTDQVKEKTPSNTKPLFTLLNQSESGFYFMNEVNQSEDFNVITYENFYNGGGVGIGDVNNDGLPDIFMTGNTFGGRLYLNKGDLKFEQISESANIFTRGFTTDVSFVDINNDGFQDIYLCKSMVGEVAYRKNILYINNQDNTFTNKAEEYGIADDGFSNQSVFFDYDNDGDLDLYVVNHRADFDNALSIYDTKEAKGNFEPGNVFWKEEFSDKLYQNNGNGTFTNVSKKAGILNNDFSLSAVPSDLNNDGLVDLYIANDFSSKDHAYINQGNGTFKDELESRFGHIPMSSMGMDIADYNNDGYPDVVNLDMTPEGNFRQKQLKSGGSYDKYHLAVDFGFYHQVSRNMLHLNNGDGTFSEVGQLANIAYTDWSWSSLFADFDNDGWQDLFIANGHFRDITDLDYLKYRSVEALEAAGGNDSVKSLDLINLMTSTKIRNYMFANNRDLRFSDKTDDWGLGQLSFSNGSAYADLDLDGDLDLIVNNFQQESFLYRNNSRELGKGNYLCIALKGGDGNPQGFGAKVIITTNEGIQYRECTPYRGFLSSVDPTIHFGLGEKLIVKSIEIEWPSGKRQILNEIKANQRIILNIENAYDTLIQKKSIEPFFTRTEKYQYQHNENNYNDFKQEPLLEHMLSNNGPIMASADVNGDGLKDFYIGSSAGFVSQLLIQSSKGNFSTVTTKDFINDKAYEDGGCAFIDVNGDNHLDLYVASGSNEFKEGKNYQDRLYINDGKGNFHKDVSLLPEITSAGSCVIPIDFDMDGDQDLFIGGFAKKNQYPLAYSSFLLENNNGEFIKNSAILPNNGSLGLVTDAVAISNNQLMVVGEWMEITLLEYDKHNGFKKLAKTGLEDSGGWWNCIKTDDLDGDGDLDFIVGNRGLNSMFQASKENPATIFWGDFDENKDLDAIPTYYYPTDKQYYPKHGLNQLFMQMKGVRKTFSNYNSYSKASLKEIIPNQENSLNVDIFESVYIENLGQGKMKISSLPIEAQFSYTQDILIKDVNKDGIKDIILVGNNYAVDVETGRADASYGTVLINEKGKFSAIPITESGFSTQALDSRSIIDISESLIVVSNNNGPLQFFKIKSK
jgi:hypothetical protein